MDQQIWMKSEEKWAYILVRRGHEVSRLKVTGNTFTLKKKVKAVLEALEQGQAPADAGAKSVETLDARSIVKASVAPGDSSLTLYGGPDGATELKYATGDENAGEILQTILAKSDRAFQPSQEAITAFEAVVGPAIIGVFAGLFWLGVNQAAGEIASGGHPEAHGRRAWLGRILIWIGGTLGQTGAMALGVALLVLIVGWTAARLIKRPERTVWLPEPA
jgi:hypothetical protein